MNIFKQTVIFIFILLTSTSFYSCYDGDSAGNPPGGPINTLETGLVTFKMNSVDVDDFNSALQTAITSFYYPNQDSNLMNVLLSRTAVYYANHDFVRTDTNYNELIIDLTNEILNLRDNNNIDTIDYRFSISFGRLFVYRPTETSPLDTSILGLATNSKSIMAGIPFYLMNTAYVFTSNIYQQYPENYYLRQSIYKYVAVHELLHQLGNSFDNSVHSWHTGPYYNRCALNNPGSFEQNIFQTTVNFLRVCDRHINEVRTNLLGQQDIQSSSQRALIIMENGNKPSSEQCDDVLNIELNKKVFKKFEPVVLQIKYINNSNDTIKLFDEFEEQLGTVQIFATNEYGKIFNENNRHSFFLRSFRGATPMYSIAPSDTLNMSMKINNWGTPVILAGKDPNTGKLFSIEDPDVYFNQLGYYEPGKYKLYVELPNQKNIKSNEIEFEVLDNSDEDKTILKMLKEHKEEEVLERYPNSPFIEHLLAIRIIGSYDIINNNNLSVNDVLQRYITFINNYPSSPYISLMSFLEPLFIRQIKNNRNISKTVSELKIAIQDGSIKTLLDNQSFVEMVIKNAERYINNY